MENIKKYRNYTYKNDKKICEPCDSSYKFGDCKNCAII